MTLRLLTNMHNTYIIYIYNNRSRGHRWWSWLYYVWIWEESHVDYTPIEFNISTRKMNLRSMRRQTLYRWCKRHMLLNLLLNIWSIPTTVITWAVLLSHLEQMFDMTFGLYDLHAWNNIYIYFLLFIKLLTHSSWDIQILIISSTQVFSWQWIYLMGLNCIHHCEERWI